MKKISALIALLSLTSTAFAADRSVRVKELQAMRTEKRVALVIGNGDYKTSPLRNPVNDARLIARTLKDLGFEVVSRENADQKQMKMAIDEFGRKIKGGGVGLFYYAGHGMEVSGRNWLIPVNADINNENEVEYESVDAGRVLAKMESSGNRVSIVVLDACRDNPFARSWRSASKGLAQTVAPEGSYIAYAAQPGAVVADGLGNNGVFTEEFVKVVKAEGMEINKAFRQVRSAVMQRTGGKQVPWTSESLTGDFYFKVPKYDAEGREVAETSHPVPAVAAAAVSPKAVGKTAAKKAEQATQADLGNAKSEREYIDSETGMVFVLVKGGCYRMGDVSGDGDSDEMPVHEACVDDFYMGKYEVTQEQWRIVMGNNPSHFSDCGENCPVEQVSWNDVKDFIRRLNVRAGGSLFRLPTEAEWEYAARSGGKNEKYAGGSDPDGVAWHGSNSGNQTHPAGQKQPNGLGLYDMSGNVWEWVEDVYSIPAYSAHTRNNPIYTGSGADRVARGGSWLDAPRGLRAANRYFDTPGSGNYFLGFRLVRTR